MPLLSSQYQGPKYGKNGHFQTILANFRPVPTPLYHRERISTPDGDFLDLDWVQNSSPKLAILSHGLEGNSTRPYIQGMAHALLANGWSILAWNYRGCSGEMNHLLRFYHSGETQDLHTVIQNAVNLKKYSQIALIGFSIGGNITLHYLGNPPSKIPSEVQAAVTFSVPCDLKAGSAKLARPAQKIYMNEFLVCLHQKIREKQKQMPGAISDKGYSKIRNFRDFDNRYTAPMHGFKNALDYWKKASCKPLLKNIKIPTLLVNAKNDPFLTPECFPFEEAEQNPYFFLETPKQGGHLGFLPDPFSSEKTFPKADPIESAPLTFDRFYWSEHRALEFLEEQFH